MYSRVYVQLYIPVYVQLYVQSRSIGDLVAQCRDRAGHSTSCWAFPTETVTTDIREFDSSWAVNTLPSWVQWGCKVLSEATVRPHKWLSPRSPRYRGGFRFIITQHLRCPGRDREDSAGLSSPAALSPVSPWTILQITIWRILAKMDLTIGFRYQGVKIISVWIVKSASLKLGIISDFLRYRSLEQEWNFGW